MVKSESVPMIYHRCKHNVALMNDESNLSDADLIESLGGTTKVAKMVGGYSRQRVWNWKIRGIPAYVKVKFPDLFLRHLMVKQPGGNNGR